MLVESLLLPVTIPVTVLLSLDRTVALAVQVVHLVASVTLAAQGDLKCW